MILNGFWEPSSDQASRCGPALFDENIVTSIIYLTRELKENKIYLVKIWVAYIVVVLR